MKNPTKILKESCIKLGALAFILSPLTGAAQQESFPLKYPLPQSKGIESSQPEESPNTSDEWAKSPQDLASVPAQLRSAYTERQFFKDLLPVQRAIWTSPLGMKRSDAKWFVPFAAATAALISTDRRVSGAISRSQDLLAVSRNTSRFGGAYASFGAPGVIYLFGKIAHRDRERETGLLGLQAVLQSYAVINTIKLATNRERPNQREGEGRFWVGGKAFPSGHAAMSWAMATVIADEYHDKPLIRFGAYGLATAVTLSRFSGRNHFPSDLLVGGALGHLIGRYVARHHSTSHFKQVSVFPYFNQPMHTCGLGVSFRF